MTDFVTALCPACNEIWVMPRLWFETELCDHYHHPECCEPACKRIEMAA